MLRSAPAIVGVVVIPSRVGQGDGEPVSGKTMLCLSRKSGQQIVIGSAIRITILKVRGEVVRIGIEAPEGLVIRCLDEPPDRPDRPGGGPARDA
jgi:hypothetical protein